MSRGVPVHTLVHPTPQMPSTDRLHQHNQMCGLQQMQTLPQHQQAINVMQTQALPQHHQVPTTRNQAVPQHQQLSGVQVPGVQTQALQQHQDVAGVQQTHAMPQHYQVPQIQQTENLHQTVPLFHPKPVMSDSLTQQLPTVTPHSQVCVMVKFLTAFYY